MSEKVELVGQTLMLAFEGLTAPPAARQWVTDRNIAGFTLFRSCNVDSPAQVRQLTAGLQAAALAADYEPLLIAADQEGGQLLGLGEGTTRFPGNMALGATRDPELARRVGYAMGRELAAVGVNVNYAPVCDVNTNPNNPGTGVRAFGDDPALVASMVAALVDGLQAAGVAATAKHFPGAGDVDVDSHYGLPVLSLDADRLAERVLPPFQAAVDANARLVMSAHMAVPALTGAWDMPATVRREIMHDLLRDRMGFEGVVITDALNMAAITQGAGQILDAVAALRAGVDLLLLTPDQDPEPLYQGLRLALSRELLPGPHLEAATRRVLALKTWVSGWEQPPLEVVACPEHRALAREVAERSVTLVRDRDGLLPLRLDAEARVLVVMPRPIDLTPAETSSYVTPILAAAVRHYHPETEEVITGNPPTGAEIAGLRETVSDYDLLILVTLSASLQPDGAVLARELLAAADAAAVPVVTVAARTPYDLTVYPSAATHVCTYSIQPVSMEVLAAALFGELPFVGQLPVTIPRNDGG